MTTPSSASPGRIAHGLCGIAIATLFLMPLAQAVDEPVEMSPWRLSGYGTLARSWDDGEHVAPIRDLSQRPEHAQETGPSWLLDTRIGAQVAYRFDARFEAVAQAVLRDQVADDADSKLELAYLQWQDGRIKARGGRIGYDAFLMSDHRNLGYAYTWVRPPTEFYGWVPAFSVDGVDIALDLPADSGRWLAKAQAGNTRTALPIGQEDFEFQTDFLWSLTLMREAGPWRFKTGLSEFRIAKEAAPLAVLHGNLELVAAAGLPAISAEAAALRQETAFANARIRYLTLGAAFDDGAWFGQAEFGRTYSDATIAPQADTGYLAIGRRFAKLSPFVMASASRPHHGAGRPQNDWGGFNTLRDGAYFALNGTRVDQTTLSTGLRWDFHSQAAAKVQWDHVRVEPEGYALWFRSLDTNPRASRINLLTLSVDFVF